MSGKKEECVGRNMEKVDCLERQGMLVVLTAPSGVGKTSLGRALVAAENERARFSISMTTRAKRMGEVHGVDYLFSSVQCFEEMLEKDGFLESSCVYGNYYGTPRQPIVQWLEEGRDVVLDVDSHGADHIRSLFPQRTVLVFILPPSMEELKRRLQQRDLSDSSIDRRFSEAKHEIALWETYDYVLVNEHFEETLARLHTIVEAERLRRHRNLYLPPFVHSLLASC